MNAKPYVFAGAPEGLRVAGRFALNAAEEGFLSSERLVMNAAGDVAFIGQHSSLRTIPGIGGIPGAGIGGLGVSAGHRPPTLALAEGTTAPGLKAGEVISFFGYEGGPFMNQSGEIVMHAEIGTAVGFEHRTDQAIWLTDPVLGPQLLVRHGAEVDLGNGRRVTLERVRFASTHNSLYSGGEDGRPRVLNDLSQVAFIANWKAADGTAGSGVFIASLVRILNGSRRGDDIQVSFATVAGRPYQLEFREAAESGVWSLLKNNLLGTGGVLSVTDVGAAKLPKRFYRLAAAP
ncbi:MAG: hypothetical protein U1G07_03865 [Verrucomicrobiota bacterium]